MFKQILFTVLALVLVSTAAQAQTGWSALNDVTTINTDDEFIIYCSTCSPDANDKMRNFKYSSINSWPDIDTTGVATNDILYQSSDGNWYVQSVDELVAAESGSISLGSGITNSGINSTVIGQGASSSQFSNVIVGQGASLTGYRSVAIGQGSTGTYSTLVGYNTSGGGSSTVLGESATSDGQDVVIGKSAQSSDGGTGRSVVIGMSTTSSGANSVVIGPSATSSANRGIAIGPYIVDGGVVATEANFDDCIVIGSGIQCTEANEIKLGGSSHTMRQDGDVHIEGSLTGGMPFKEYTSSISLSSADLGYNILFNSSGTLTATVDQIAGADSGEGYVIIKKGTGNVTISAGSGVTLNSKGTTLSTQYGAAAVQFQSADEVWVTGEVE